MAAALLTEAWTMTKRNFSEDGTQSTATFWRAATESLDSLQILYVHLKQGAVVVGSSFVRPTTKLSKLPATNTESLIDHEPTLSGVGQTNYSAPGNKMNGAFAHFVVSNNPANSLIHFLIENSAHSHALKTYLIGSLLLYKQVLLLLPKSIINIGRLQCCYHEKAVLSSDCKQ